MKTFSLTLASTLLLFAAFLLYDSSIPAQSEKKAASRRSGSEVIEKAIEQFQAIKTIESDVRLKCSFFGEGYGGSGYYSEKRISAVQEPVVSPNLFSLALRFQADSLSSLDASPSTLRVVATGTDIWKYTDMENERRLERVELGKLQDILARSQKGNESSSKIPSTGLGELTSLGGLEGTLIQVMKFYDFNSALVEGTQLDSGNLTAWKVSAKLKPDHLKAMTESYGGEKAVAVHGGGHIPAGVCLYFGQENFFPYRICYYGGVKENPFNDPPSIDLEYRNVKINERDISTSGVFVFDRVEGVFIKDVTEIYAQRILK